MGKVKKGEVVKSFEEIISFESLYKAHRRARLGKRHKKEVVEFELNLSENLWKLHYELKYGTYEISDYNEFKVYDPKERDIQAIHYRDRIVQHSICDNFFIPVLERRLIYDNGACRVRKGTHFIINRLKGYMREYYKANGCTGYFIKFDIRKYFPSIVHSVLLKKIRQLPIDEQTYELTSKIIRSYGEGYGLPMGNQSSQCFALYYLDKVDRYIKEKLKIRCYVRYMDDMIIMVNNKAKAKEVFEKVSAEIVRSGLEVNKKSQIISVKNGIEFLGWRFHYDANGVIVQTMKHGAVKRIKTKVNARANELKGKRGNSGQIDAVLCSYKGHLMHGRAFRFYKNIESKLNSARESVIAING